MSKNNVEEMENLVSSVEEVSLILGSLINELHIVKEKIADIKKKTEEDTSPKFRPHDIVKVVNSGVISQIINGGQAELPDGRIIQVHQYAVRLNGGAGPTVYVMEDAIVEGPLGTYEPPDVECPVK